MRPDLLAASDLDQAAYVLLRVDGWRTVHGRRRTPTLLEVAELVDTPWRRVIELHDLAVREGLAVAGDCTWVPTADGRAAIDRQARPIEGQLVALERVVVPRAEGEGRRCRVCDDPIDHLRAHAEVCRKTACRRTSTRRRLRGDDYEMTEEDLAAWRRVLEREGCGHPGVPLTPEAVRTHVATSAVRTGELAPAERAELDALDATARRPRANPTPNHPPSTEHA